jgi:hypothetical protein
MRKQKGRAVPQHQFRVLPKSIANREQAKEDCSEHSLLDTGGYLLQVDGQTKRSFKTLEAAHSAAQEIKARSPRLQVTIYDSVSKSRNVVNAPTRGS